MNSLKKLASLSSLASRQSFLPLRRWAHEEASGEGAKPFSKKEFDAQRYGGFKSIDRLIASPATKGVVGRVDWHLWHFMLALIPPGMIILLAKWARDDMQAKQRIKLEKAQAEMIRTAQAMQQLQEAKGGGEEDVMDESAELRQRLDELERVVQTLVTRQSEHRNDTHSAAALRPAEPSTVFRPHPPNRTESAAAAESACAAGALARADRTISPDSPPLSRLPDNPLDRWLPETDCQFCNDTRQRLWGAFKSATGYKSSYDKEHFDKKAAPQPRKSDCGNQYDSYSAQAANSSQSDQITNATAPTSQYDTSVDIQQKHSMSFKPMNGKKNDEGFVTSGCTGPSDSSRTCSSTDSLNSTCSELAPGTLGAPEFTERGCLSAHEDILHPHQQLNHAKAGSKASSARDRDTVDRMPAADLQIAQSSSGAGTVSSEKVLQPQSTSKEQVAVREVAGSPTPLPKLPDNPLDRWLPETDCQFCNDTRQKLWSAFRNSTGYNGIAHDSGASADSVAKDCAE